MSSSEQLAEILLVDDCESDIAFTRQVFEDARITNRVHVANSGDAALDFIRQRRAHGNKGHPDIILLDMNLPGLDGGEVLEQLKSDPATRNIPVLILTGSEPERSVAQKARGADGILIKPISLPDLVRAMRSLEQLCLGLVAAPCGKKKEDAS